MATFKTKNMIFFKKCKISKITCNLLLLGEGFYFLNKRKKLNYSQCLEDTPILYLCVCIYIYIYITFLRFYLRYNGIIL